MEVQMGGHWWEPPSQQSVASVETAVCLAARWQGRAENLEELETKKKEQSGHELEVVMKQIILLALAELLPFCPMTDSGDVSSNKDVDMLVLLRVPSSCQLQQIFHHAIISTTLYQFKQFNTKSCPMSKKIHKNQHSLNVDTQISVTISVSNHV